MLSSMREPSESEIANCHPSRLVLFFTVFVYPFKLQNMASCWQLCQSCKILFQGAATLLKERERGITKLCEILMGHCNHIVIKSWSRKKIDNGAFVS